MLRWRNQAGNLKLKYPTRSARRNRSRAVNCACEPLETRRLLTTVSWVNNNDGDWSVGSNWSTGSAPTASDDVVIDVPGRNVTVTYSAGATLQLHNLLNNEVLDIANTNGATWTGGLWDGSGSVLIENKLAISGSADKILKDGEAIVNFGTTTLTGTGNIVGQVGASITNEPGATFDVQSDADITFPSGVGDGIFENGGTFIKSGGGTAAGNMTEIGGAQGFRFENSINDIVDPKFSIPGDCQIQQGTLGLGDNQNIANTYGGTFEISANATLNYLRGQHNIVVLHPPMGAPDIIPSITGAGTLAVSGGMVQSYGVLSVHKIDMSAGSLLLQQNMTEFSGSPQKNTNPNPTPFGTTDILNLSGGTFGGNGGGIFPAPSPINIEEEPALVVGASPQIVPGATAFNWSGGTLAGAGRLVIDPNTTSSLISTTAAKAINGGFGLDILDETLWKDSGTITMNGSSVVYIHGSGTLFDQGNGTIVEGSVDTNGGSIWNTGNILKLGGTGTTTFGNGINFINDIGALNFVTASIPIIQYPDTGSVQLAKLAINTGTFSLSGTSTNRDDILIQPGATLSYDGGTHNNQTYSNSNDVINASILGVNSGGTINFGAATFVSDNESLVDVATAHFGAGTYTFNNPAGGAQRIKVGDFNGGTIGGSGTLEVTSSMLWNSGIFTGTGAGTGSLLIDSSATLTIPSGDRSTTNTYSIDNRGTVRWTTSPGTLNINGNYTQSSTGKFISGIVTTNQITGLDNVVATGIVSVAGNLTLTVGTYSPVDGQKLTLISNGNAAPVIGTFAGLPEGAKITVGTNIFTISYIGGDGNDVVLTAVVPPVITIAAPAPFLEGNVGNTNLSFVVSIPAVTTVGVSVNYATSSGTATSGSDFVPTSGTITIAAGQTSATILVPIIGDTTVEQNETFSVTLSNPVNADLGNPSVAVGTILDDDGPPVLTLQQTSYEVRKDLGRAVLTVVRTNTSVPVSVDYTTVAGTAVADQNYTTTTGTLQFAVGVASLTITVPIIDDLIHTGDTNFTVVLSNPQGHSAVLGNTTAQVTILDTDPALRTITIADLTVTEQIYGTLDGIFNLTVPNATVVPVTITYMTVDGTALAGSDYVASSGTVTLLPNTLSTQIHVPINADFDQEDTEQFTVILTGITGDAVLGRSSAVGTILNQPVNTVTIDAQHPFKYLDASGHRAIWSIVGAGTGTIKYLGGTQNDVKTIVLDGTTEQSRFVVRTTGGQTALVDLTVNGSLKSIDAPVLNLLRDLNVTGAVQTIRMASLSAGSTVEVGTGSGAFTSVAAKFAHVTDAKFTSSLPVSALTFADWSDTSAAVDIVAPAVAKISATGNFQADATIAGDLGVLRVGKVMDGSTIRVGGNLGSLSAMTINNSVIFAGVLDATTVLPTNTAQFANTASSIRTLTVRSKADGSFGNTLIAAPAIGNVQLGTIAVANGGVAFGVAGDSIQSVRGANAQKIKLTNADLASGPFSEKDLVIRLVSAVLPL